VTWLAITVLGLVLECALVIALGRAVTGRDERCRPPVEPSDDPGRRCGPSPGSLAVGEEQRMTALGPSR